MKNIKLDHFNTFMITMIILIFIIYYVMKYNKITENFSTYGYVACPPQFTKVGDTKNIYYNEGNVGIGIDNPTNKLDVNGTSRVIGELKIQGPNRTSHICHSSGHSYIRGGKTNHYVLLNDNGGNVGIGTGSPQYTLDVTGDINISDGSQFKINGVPLSTSNYGDSDVRKYLDNGINSLKLKKNYKTDGIIEQRPYYHRWEGWSLKAENGDCLDISCGSAYIRLYDYNLIVASDDISDEREKTNIIKVNDNTQYMQYFRECNMYKYNLKNKLEQNPEDIPEDGFIAQELENIIPKAVSKIKGTIRDINTKCTIINDIIELDINGKINYDIKENDILELQDDSSNKINITIKNIIDKNKYTIYPCEDINYNANYKVTGYVVNDMRHLDYNTLTRISIGAIKYVDSEVTKLKEIIEKQQEQIKFVDSEVTKLKEIIEKQQDQIKLLIESKK